MESSTALGALANYHEENEFRQADPRGKCGFRRVPFDALFDFRFQVPRHAVHPDNHGDHKNSRDQKEHALESVFANIPALQRDGDREAGRNRGENASPHPARKIRAPRAIQIDEHDADNQGGFDTFTKSD